MEAVRVGIIGVGNISGIYIECLQAFAGVDLIACADIDQDRASGVAAEKSIPKALSVDELLRDYDVELVLNLTIPAAHGPVALQALENGKHVYNEKPLAVSLSDAQALVVSAAEKGLRVGCAPDTFLGSGQQTARRAIDDGLIGTPIGAQAAFLAHGPEDWHPNPDFFYQNGGGPMLDMGPYYVTALTNLLGPVTRVSGSARASQTTRKVSLKNERYYARPDRAAFAGTGYEIPVETPTHYVGVLDFESGAIGDLCTSFDIWHHRNDWAHPITIYGTEGTLLVPDPNNFGGEVKLKRHDDEDWRTLENVHTFNENSRGLGVMDMAFGIRTGAKHRASGELALHALEVMLGVRTASEESRYVTPTTQPERPAALGVDEYSDPRPPKVD
jgi:predicted dehydrogenase